MTSIADNPWQPEHSGVKANLVLPMTEPFLSAKVRVGRAKELLDTLKNEGKAFWESHPYIFISEPDSDGLTKPTNAG